LKFKHGKDMRRVTVEQPLTFQTITNLMGQLFPALHGYTLKYEDPDGDKITVSSQEEIQEAVSVAMSSNGVLRFLIFEKQEVEAERKAPVSIPAAAPVPAPVPVAFVPVPAPAGPSVHDGVTCDGCQVSPIVGIRYKCFVCRDFDLCAACEATKTHDQSHPLLQMNQSNVAPWKMHCQRRRHGPDSEGPAMGHHHGMGRWGRMHHNMPPPPFGAPMGVPPVGQMPPPPGFGWGEHPKCMRKLMKLKYLARFVADVTIEDGSILKPAERFNKVWRMRNSGEEAWPEETFLAFVGGDRLGAAVEQIPLTRSVQPQEEVDLAVEMTAPEQPGRYTGYWRLVTPNGRFGQRVWVDILVNPAPATAPSAPVAPVVPSVAAPTPFVPPSSPSPVVVAFPVPVPVQAPAPVAAPVVPGWFAVPEAPAVTEEESKSLGLLKEMGFSGDLLVTLRKHRGDLVSTIRDLCGH